MGREVDDALGLTPRVEATWAEDEPANAFAADRALPARIWYADLVAGIYHERRTNTYIAYDPVHAGWAAVPADMAVVRGFRPERARLLPHGPPGEVKKVMEYLTSMEPGWRGS
jgi:hypothetical protein